MKKEGTGFIPQNSSSEIILDRISSFVKLLSNATGLNMLGIFQIEGKEKPLLVRRQIDPGAEFGSVVSCGLASGSRYNSKWDYHH